MLVDFIGNFVKMFNQIHNTTINESHITEWDFTKVPDIKLENGIVITGKQLQDFFYEYARFGLFSTATARPGVTRALAEMRSKGYVIIIMTARETQYKPDTLWNIKVNGFKVDHLFFEKDKAKAINKLKSIYRIRYFVDDNIRNATSVFTKAKVPTFLMNKTHNLGNGVLKGMKRVDSLLDVLSFL